MWAYSFGPSLNSKVTKSPDGVILISFPFITPVNHLIKQAQKITPPARWRCYLLRHKSQRRYHRNCDSSHNTCFTELSCYGKSLLLPLATNHFDLMKSEWAIPTIMGLRKLSSKKRFLLHFTHDGCESIYSFVPKELQKLKS